MDHKDVEMTFMEHLEELRTRILYSLYALGPALILGFLGARPLLEILTRHARTLPFVNRTGDFPFKVGISSEVGLFLLLDPPETKTVLVGLAPTEAIMAYVKVALLAAVFIAFPAIMYQVWKFIEPGLRSHEKKFLVPFILSSWFAFLGGALFAYIAVLKVAIPFLANFGHGILENSWSLAFYISFVLRLLLVFGVVFEMPVAAALFSMLGLLSPEFLRKYRRYAILVIFVAAAFLTPPDPFTQLLLAGPLVLLYETSILVSRFTYRPPGSGLIPTEE